MALSFCSEQSTKCLMMKKQYSSHDVSFFKCYIQPGHIPFFTHQINVRASWLYQLYVSSLPSVFFKRILNAFAS
jgi:hypothetical protein